MLLNYCQNVGRDCNSSPSVFLRTRWPLLCTSGVPNQEHLLGSSSTARIFINASVFLEIVMCFGKHCALRDKLFMSISNGLGGEKSITSSVAANRKQFANNGSLFIIMRTIHIVATNMACWWKRLTTIWPPTWASSSFLFWNVVCSMVYPLPSFRWLATSCVLSSAQYSDWLRVQWHDFSFDEKNVAYKTVHEGYPEQYVDCQVRRHFRTNLDNRVAKAKL